jgi:CheY-like chemotaxis protein
MTRHILLVDDDALLRRSLAFNLEKAGYRASTAASAEDALALDELAAARSAGNYALIRHWERELAFHGSGHLLHTLFWENMAPGGGGQPDGALAAQIASDFGSFDAFHAYPWLIHRLTYRRTNNDNSHVRGYKEEGTITTPFDSTVLNEMEHFHLVMDAVDRLPQTGDKGIYLKQQLEDKMNQRSSQCLFNSTKKTAGRYLSFMWWGSWQQRITLTLCPRLSGFSASTESCVCCST